MSAEEIFKVAATSLQALAIVVTAIFASRGLKAWRHQLVGKRRFEVAEEVLVGAQKARWNLRYIRNPVVFSGEGTSLEGRGRDRTSSVPLERIQKIADELAELQKTRVLAEVHLGPAAGEFIGAVLQPFHDVTWAANMLAMTSGEPIPEDGQERKEELDRRQRWRLTIWGGPADSDPLTKHMDETIAKLETICRPFLRGLRPRRKGAAQRGSSGQADPLEVDLGPTRHPVESRWGHHFVFVDVLSLRV